MQKIKQADPDDAARLAALYAKAFKATAFKEFAVKEKRSELVLWMKDLCEKGKIWLRCDAEGPIVLGHFDEKKDEVITIVTRDNMEGQGEATAMLKYLVVLHPSLIVRPVTKGGQSVARKSGFSPTKDDRSLWVRTSE